ncbi:sigma-70 family RNA polymerase sigma factor [Tuwongella immobilis]|uniref:Response regulator receiver: RNA polymerase sigma factor, sigma-70 family n=1 Tax=Tuwongella immobilis TaxID=692036 RepID=A0A6C2YHJ7_9BACT|nr:sigma-70 family RNA polymerase sigma factor [Tuwongella immobilis]VIP01000.1 response regulator receiver : RNA polymerase sigma factor, sigma-70 family OS=Isosphaera pallida (strain ATCC 43644 / DSM 9630 / IS1B) GN=Isop_0081 PE=4 SV=1 [Tuwongella immobilis]VTR97424.1 response regulator receiver : RNA polymerase sigma factor, sigma-70 family OS=Isosphaera pallida (strain ATCC 43644 / DSM 9630 / IS1B) GN=Isop_0081 PE=4 SV=1 [Tuwongella immobilis]
MMAGKSEHRGLSRSGWMAVMVLGTTLSTLSPAVAAQDIDELTRYCTACWRNARLPEDRWSDCTQEVFTRLLETIDRERWNTILRIEGPEQKEFYRAIDAVKKRVQRRRKETPIVADPASSPQREVNQRETWEQVDSAAKRLLSDRQRRILELSRDGWSVPEMAAEFATTPERISDEKYKAIRKLQRELANSPEFAIHQ